jgi:hypothetical protein
VLGFAGTREEVEWQMVEASELGLNEPSNLGHEQFLRNDDPPPHRLSVSPARVVEAIRGLAGAAFVARAGNGVIYHRDGPPPVKSELPIGLMRRVKDAFDAKHILPELPL